MTKPIALALAERAARMDILRRLSATPDLSRVSDRGTLMVTLPGPRMSVSAQVRMRGVR